LSRKKLRFLFAHRVGRRRRQQGVEITLPLLFYDGAEATILINADDNSQIATAPGEDKHMTSVRPVSQFGELSPRFGKINYFVQLVHS
jgi:hypothetical protein